MNLYLLVLDPKPDKIESVFPRAKAISYALSGYEIDFDANPNREFQNSVIYKIDERDVSAAVERLTEWNLGKEVVVLRPERIFQRPPGTLTEKKITVEGVLPV